MYRRTFRTHKFNAQKVSTEGRSFGSKLEAALYTDYLKPLEMAGEIRDIQQQDHVYMTLARIGYVADYKFFDVKLGEWVWAEAKGFPTPEWKLKLRLWKAGYGPGRLLVFGGSHNRLVLQETVIPKATDATSD